MNLVPTFYIAFASISIFAFVLQLFIVIRKNGDRLFLLSAILSIVVFISYLTFYICDVGFSKQCPTLDLLRIQLILNLVLLICMLEVILQFLITKNRSIKLIHISILGFFIFLSLFIPDSILYGEKITYFDSFSDDFSNPLTGKGFTIYRLICDLAILMFSVSAILILIKNLDNISFRTIVIFFIGIGIIILSALSDQLTDLGHLKSVYFIPFALFIFYIIIIFIPFVFFIKEILSQQNIIARGENWFRLVNQAEVIVVELDRMGHVRFINSHFCTLTGYREIDVIGKDWFEFFIPPKEYYNVQGTFVEILEFEFHPFYLNPILTKNKEEKMIKWFNVRTWNKQGNITGSLSIGIDMTDELNEKDILLKKLDEAERLIAILRSRDI